MQSVQKHIESVGGGGGGCDMAGQQFEANLGDSGAECQPHWETGHLAGNRTPASYLQSNGIIISIGN